MKISYGESLLLKVTTPVMSLDRRPNEHGRNDLVVGEISTSSMYESRYKHNAMPQKPKEGTLCRVQMTSRSWVYHKFSYCAVPLAVPFADPSAAFFSFEDLNLAISSATALSSLALSSGR